MQAYFGNQNKHQIVNAWAPCICIYNDTNVDPKYINSEFMHMRYVCIHVVVTQPRGCLRRIQFFIQF